MLHGVLLLIRSSEFRVHKKFEQFILMQYKCILIIFKNLASNLEELNKTLLFNVSNNTHIFFKSIYLIQKIHFYRTIDMNNSCLAYKPFDINIK